MWVSLIHLSAYAKADILKYWNTRRDARHFVKGTHCPQFELRKGDPHRFVRKTGRLFSCVWIDLIFLVVEVDR